MRFVFRHPPILRLCIPLEKAEKAEREKQRAKKRPRFTISGYMTRAPERRNG